MEGDRKDTKADAKRLGPIGRAAASPLTATAALRLRLGSSLGVSLCRERFLKIVLAFSEKCAIIIGVLRLFLQTTRWVFLPRARDSQGFRFLCASRLPCFHTPPSHPGAQASMPPF